MVDFYLIYWRSNWTGSTKFHAKEPAEDRCNADETVLMCQMMVVMVLHMLVVVTQLFYWRWMWKTSWCFRVKMIGLICAKYMVNRWYRGWWSFLVRMIWRCAKRKLWAKTDHIRDFCVILLTEKALSVIGGTNGHRLDAGWNLIHGCKDVSSVLLNRERLSLFSQDVRINRWTGTVVMVVRGQSPEACDVEENEGASAKDDGNECLSD